MRSHGRLHGKGAGWELEELVQWVWRERGREVTVDNERPWLRLERWHFEVLLRVPREERPERALSLPGARRDVPIANATIQTPAVSACWFCHALCSTFIPGISGPCENQEAFGIPF